MSLRTDRVSEIIRKVIGTKLAEVMPASPLTITGVDVSPDLRYATVWLISLDTKDVEAELENLKEHRPKLQAELASQLKSKFTPSLNFRLDHSTEHVNRIDELLDNITP